MRLMVGFLVLNCPRVDMVAVEIVCVCVCLGVSLAAVQREWVSGSGGG
jgi:hypothetical protein